MKSRKIIVWAVIIAMCLLMMPVSAMAATKVTRISMGSSSVTMKVGEKYRLSYTLSPSKATTSDIRFTSSSSRVSVTSTGWLTAKSVGSATITVKARSGSAVAYVRVNVVSKVQPTPAPKKVASVSDIVAIINSERKNYGYGSLSNSSSANSQADALARQYINNPGMRADKNEILFTASDGDSARTVASILIREAGANILRSRYTSIGMDCYTDSRGRQYWAVVLLPKAVSTSTPAKTPTPTPVPTPVPTPTSSKVDTQDLEAKLLKAINSKRSDSISRSSTLNSLARKRAQDLATRFDHTRPNGVFVTDFVANQGFPKDNFDECIAKTAKGSTIADVIDAWSGNAYGNALFKDQDPSGAARSHSKIGIGCYEAPNGTLYWSVLMVK